MHAPQRVLDEFFAEPSLPAGVAASETLDLTVELRFHFAADLDEWVDGLLTGGTDARGRELAARLESAGYQLRMTRDLDQVRIPPKPNTFSARPPLPRLGAGGVRGLRRAHPRMVRAGRAHRLGAGDPHG